MDSDLCGVRPRDVDDARSLLLLQVLDEACRERLGLVRDVTVIASTRQRQQHAVVTVLLQYERQPRMRNLSRHRLGFVSTTRPSRKIHGGVKAYSVLLLQKQVLDKLP